MRYTYWTDKGPYLSDDAPEMVARPGYWRGLYHGRTGEPVAPELWPSRIVSCHDRLAVR